MDKSILIQKSNSVIVLDIPCRGVHEEGFKINISFSLLVLHALNDLLLKWDDMTELDEKTEGCVQNQIGRGLKVKMVT